LTQHNNLRVDIGDAAGPRDNVIGKMLACTFLADRRISL